MNPDLRRAALSLFEIEDRISELRRLIGRLNNEIAQRTTERNSAQTELNTALRAYSVQRARLVEEIDKTPVDPV